MASDWRLSVTMIDSKALKTTLNFEGTFSGLSLDDEFGLATTAADDLITDLEAVSDANVYSQSLTHLRGGGTALPADADITDELAIVCFLTAAGVLPEYHTLRVPAPIAAAFESDLKTLDESNANVIAYVANFDLPDNGFQVSDGQYVDTTNENGISHGFWRSRAKSSQ